MRHARHTVSGILILACVSLAAQQLPPTRSAATGIYTAEQATAGEKIYFDKCATCHGTDLAGIERAPALAGSSFVQTWQGRDLRLLRDRLDTMPPTAPRSLSDADATAIIAFLLRSSDLPAGRAALPADRSELARITFARSK